MAPSLDLQTLNSLDQAAFRQQLGFLFEHSPWVVEQTWQARPFTSTIALHDALARSMYDAAPEQQLALIQAHPDLAGKAAIAGDLTAESTREQSSAGLDRLTPDEYAEFHRLNTAYHKQFGFPFIICVREHTKESILANFRQRLNHNRENEITTALAEIAKIVRLRLLDSVGENA